MIQPAYHPRLLSSMRQVMSKHVVSAAVVGEVNWLLQLLHTSPREYESAG